MLTAKLMPMEVTSIWGSPSVWPTVSHESAPRNGLVLNDHLHHATAPVQLRTKEKEQTHRIAGAGGSGTWPG